jgi:hypothetical protein
MDHLVHMHGGLFHAGSISIGDLWHASGLVTGVFVVLYEMLRLCFE